MWHDLWPWLLAVLILGLTITALWLALRRPRVRAVDDHHERAVERWLNGDLTAARELMREAVRREPDRSLPYLQLGTLLRMTGDPGRAAALHRSLSVRTDLSAGRRAKVGIELAEDLLALSKHEEAHEILRQLDVSADSRERWYRLRFAAALGCRKPDLALTALQEGEKALPEDAAGRLRRLRAAWLTDRVLRLIRAGQHDAAGRYLSHAKKIPEAEGRVYLLKALIAAHDGNDDRAVDAVAEGLARHPAEMAPALALLENALLNTGRFTMVVPMLETACRDETAPPDLWIALAQLYEKLDRREDALRFLQSKSHDPRLTPDAAAPYLRLLAAEMPDAAFSRLWSFLRVPGSGPGFLCTRCGHHVRELQWFCANCLSPDSFTPADVDREEIRGGHGETLAMPPRY